MIDSITLSRGRLVDFLTCQRRFQLRYLDNLPWPSLPMSVEMETAVSRGHAFHQLIQQYFLGLKIVPAAIEDVKLRQWWTKFLQFQATLPNGRFLPEMSLTVPVGERGLLNGRFDLLVIRNDTVGEPFIHIYDWKTGKPQDEMTLNQDWQTRLYLAMLAEGHHAIKDDQVNKLRVASDNVEITYWYVQEANAPRKIRYNSEWHTQNWAEIQQIVSQIEAQVAQSTENNVWPLTENESHCRPCGYQTYCGRQKDDGSSKMGEKTAVSQNHPDDEQEPIHLQLEPNLP